MKPQRMFWIMLIVALFFAASVYFSGKKRDERRSPEIEALKARLQAATPFPQASASASGSQSQIVMPTPLPVPKATPCTPQAEFFEVRGKLGKLVNGPMARYHPSYFLKAVNDFRLPYGLPFALTTLPTNKLEDEGVVYNNCRPTCRGTVNLVFVSRLVHNRFVEVYTKSGKLKQLALHDSGLDVATVDELNHQGVPFRSWRVPVTDADWYIAGNNLFYAMDIEGLWLEVTPAGVWTVVAHPKNLAKLEVVEPAVKIPGCVNDENCLQASIGRKVRHFKSPQSCQPVLANSADEPVEHSDSPTPAPSPHPGLH